MCLSVVHFYNCTPTVESYFRGQPVRYHSYLGSWHFCVPAATCGAGALVGILLAPALAERQKDARQLAANQDLAVYVVLSDVPNQSVAHDIVDRMARLLPPNTNRRSTWSSDSHSVTLAVSPLANVDGFISQITFARLEKVDQRQVYLRFDPDMYAAAQKRDQETAAAQFEATRRRVEANMAAVKAEAEKRRKEFEQRNAEIAGESREESKAREKAFRTIESGPGWTLERTVGKIDPLLTHSGFGYRMRIPEGWKVSPSAESIPTINPQQGRESVLAFTNFFKNALLRIDTYTLSGTETAADTLKQWDKAQRGKSAYRRTHAVMEQSFGKHMSAGMSYAWRDARSAGDYEVWAVRCDKRLYLVTIAVQQDRFAASVSVDDLKKALRSFELIEEPAASGTSTP